MAESTEKEEKLMSLGSTCFSMTYILKDSVKALENSLDEKTMNVWNWDFL